MKILNFLMIVIATVIAHIAQMLDIVTTSAYNLFVSTGDEYNEYTDFIMGALGEMIDGQ